MQYTYNKATSLAKHLTKANKNKYKNISKILIKNKINHINAKHFRQMTLIKSS